MTTSDGTGHAPTRKGGRRTAHFWFDPACPWAWVTSRWIDEVTRVRPVDVHWHVMSLTLLNEGRDLGEEYQARLATMITRVRVITAAQQEFGDGVVKPLYDAMGVRLHPGGRRDDPAVIGEALAEVGLPLRLADAATTADFDAALRRSHEEGMAQVGHEVGTPIVSFGDAAFFGPVVTPAPKGDAAGRLWDGCVLLAGTAGFYELKRSRDQRPAFD